MFICVYKGDKFIKSNEIWSVREASRGFSQLSNKANVTLESNPTE